MHHIQVFLWQAAMMQHAYPLLEGDACSCIWLDKGFVAHIERAHHLKDWDFDRKVKWRDHSNRSIWEPIGCIVLPHVVAWLLFAVCQEPNTVTTEVFVKVNCNIKFCLRLDVTLRCHTLDKLYKEVKHFGVIHAFDQFAVDFSQHQVSFLVSERIVQS